MKFLTIFMLTIPFFANAATDFCKGDGYKAVIKGNSAVVTDSSGKSTQLALLHIDYYYPLYENSNRSMTLAYINQVGLSLISTTKYTAKIGIGEAMYNLICDNP